MADICCQTWKQYPYNPEGSRISFPEDEGRHVGEPVEWWYTNGHVMGKTSGHDYTYMLAFFYYTDTPLDGMRILTICDETTGEYHSQTVPVSYKTISTNHLEIDALLPLMSSEYWHTSKDSTDNLIPFEYEIKSGAGFGNILLNYVTRKAPLILSDSGYLFQGKNGYTYYYSQTGIDVTGNLSFGGVNEEVNGTAWIDRQYGVFDPLKGEKYEWFSIQLSNGVDLNLWNIFNDNDEIPDRLSYRTLCGYLNDSVSFTSSDFLMNRLGFMYMSDSLRCYAKKWRLMADTFNIDLMLETTQSDNEIVLPLRFFEGNINVSGFFNGEEVTGYGFTELIHSYSAPQIQFDSFPGSIISGDSLIIKWLVTNPDEGNPLLHCISLYDDSGNQIHEECVREKYRLAFKTDVNYTRNYMIVKLESSSVDTTLITQITEQLQVQTIQDIYAEYIPKGNLPFDLRKSENGTFHILNSSSNGILKIISTEGRLLKSIQIIKGGNFEIKPGILVSGVNIFIFTYPSGDRCIIKAHNP